LHTKRQVITQLMESGLYPYTKHYLGTFRNHFSTIGLVGMNEVGLNAPWLGHDLTHPDTQAFAVEVLTHMRARLSDYQEQYGDLLTREATPAESTRYRFAQHAAARFPLLHSANGHGTPSYSAASRPPVGCTAEVFEALDVQDQLQ